MNKKTILTAMTFGLIAGCARLDEAKDPQQYRYSYSWSKDGATSADLSRDKYDCETSVQQRLTMSQQAMNQYKYARNNMGIVGLGLDEPEEINEEDVPALLNKCIESRGWKAKKGAVAVGDDGEESDLHTFQFK